MTTACAVTTWQRCGGGTSCAHDDANSACARTRHRSTPPPPTCLDDMHDRCRAAQVQRTRDNCPPVEPYPIPIRQPSASGFKGVTKATSCYQAKMSIGEKEVQLGSGHDVSASLPPPACPHSTSPQLSRQNRRRVTCVAPDCRCACARRCSCLAFCGLRLF